MKHLLLVLMICAMSFETAPAKTKIKLIYVGDPMCSWCYGFTPNLTEALSKYGSAIELEVVLGGLRPYHDESMKEMSSFLKRHWEQVSTTSKQAFSYGILDSTILYDTEPACRAVMVFREMKPGLTFQFFKAAQTAFYLQNKNPLSVETYSKIAAQMGVNPVKFEERFNSAAAKEKIKDDFKRSRALGVSGFPTLLIYQNGEYHTIANGYTSANRVRLAIDSKLKK